MLETNNLQSKKTCALCHNSLIIKNFIYGNKIEESQWEEDLVYPCLCSIRAHRDCLKAYILTKKTMVCERCKAVYAISGKKRKNVKMTTGDIVIMSITILLCFGIVIAGIILIAVGFGETSSKTGMGIGGIIMMVAGVMGIMYIFWRKYFSKKNVDIFVNCKQTEIARHEDDPERIVKKFLDGEERKRSSTVLRKAKELLKLLDVTEFENFIKLATPRVDKDEKETIRYERRGSSNFLLPDFNPLDRDEKGKQVQKEIFISPNEVRNFLTNSFHIKFAKNHFFLISYLFGNSLRDLI